VAGVKVGTISAVELTPDNKAALVLRINGGQFQPFRTDAHCEIGVESLLGEQFVQCTPTQPRAPGSAVAPALPAIASGPDRGQHLLPVQNTTTPVGVDLLADITRLPQQQRLRLIIAGLGAGLAANGHELNAALVRADPALQQTDAAIAVLARQNRLLANLTDESDKILAPLAAQRAHLGGFIQHAGTVALAAAQEGHAIEQNFQDFPAFLRQLRPAAVRLTNLAKQMRPALQSLQAQAPAINDTVNGLGPLAKASIPALQTLGHVAQRGEVVFPRAHAVAEQLGRLATPLLPLATNLASLSSSFDNAGGIEDVMRFIYYYTGSVNGEDALGHYIRSLVEISNLQRTSSQTPGSGSTFRTTTLTAAADAVAHATSATARELTAGGSGVSGARALINYLLAP
jgi:ABC-type transporter Mla subunit MlaD